MSVSVSVIVPVYNSERYLRQCLDSILAQTLADIEILCVDDGSTDESPQILAEYAQKDARLSVFHQENLYAGVARNLGMSHASGKYLVFWDSDDYFYPDALLRMYEKCEADAADVCVCGGNQFLEDLGREMPVERYANAKRLPEKIPFNRHTNPDHLLNFTSEAPWNKMFRRGFISEQGLTFQPCRNGNDVYFVISALCLAERITVVTDRLVCYRKNQADSLVGSLRKAPISPFRAWMDVRRELIARDAFPERSYVNKLLGSFFYLLRNLNTWDSYLEAYTFLHEGEGLARFSLRERPREFYDTDWYYDGVAHLLADSPEDFHVFLSYLTYVQMSNSNVRRSELRRKLLAEREKTAALREKLTSVRGKRDALMVRNEKQAAKIDALRKQREKLRGERDDLKKELGDAGTDVLTLRRELADIKGSFSYRFARVLTYLPRKLRGLFRS